MKVQQLNSVDPLISKYIGYYWVNSLCTVAPSLSQRFVREISGADGRLYVLDTARVFPPLPIQTGSSFYTARIFFVSSLIPSHSEEDVVAVLIPQKSYWIQTLASEGRPWHEVIQTEVGPSPTRIELGRHSFVLHQSQPTLAVNTRASLLTNKRVFGDAIIFYRFMLCVCHPLMCAHFFIVSTAHTFST